jgi:glycine betaine/proline transport system ATP-binding protein
VSAIEVKHLYKVFGPNPRRGVELLEQGQSKQALLERGLAIGVRDASLRVEAGEFLVVMGLSGSGKSTLLRCLNRLIAPTCGEVFLDGVDITRLSDKALREVRMRKFGMVFQHFALLPHRTVLENAAFGLELQRVDPAERSRRAAEALELVGLSGWAGSLPGELSGGMQQRVGLARALAVNPDILLMDEAFSALDPLIRRDMQEELLGLQSRMRKTIVFITHDLDEALLLGDRIVIMKDGQIVQVGAPETILTQPADDYVARFVEKVDVSKVLTAEAVMHKASSITWPKDGPKAALHKMREVGISGIMVRDRDQRLLGVISAEDAARALDAHVETLEGLIRPVPSVRLETPLAEIFGIAQFPVAVVDEERRLRGLVVRGALLAALAGNRAPERAAELREAA